MAQHKYSQSGHATLVLLVVLVLAIVGVIGVRVAKHQQGKTTVSSTSNKASTTSGSTADLTNDLQSVDASLSQEGTASNNANTALDDQQNEIVVPTE